MEGNFTEPNDREISWSDPPELIINVPKIVDQTQLELVINFPIPEHIPHQAQNDATRWSTDKSLTKGYTQPLNWSYTFPISKKQQFKQS